ncbi:hypothetical protein MO973_24255 [Paenibacillus sp. TRM 82003]|nr:hypothetical protein [Paenibacillus sp. TRM 82003]
MNSKRRKQLMAVSALALSFAIGGIVASDFPAQAAAVVEGDTGAETTTPDASAKTDAAPAERSGFGHKHRGGGHGGMMLGDASALATLFNLTSDELREALRNGKTLADIAAAQGVDVQAVIDASVASMKAKLDERLAEGKLTKAQYDELAATVTDKATKLVNGELGGGKAKFGRGIGGEPIVAEAELAALLSLSAEQLKEAVTGGKTLAEIAGEQGIEVQAVIDLLVKKMTEKLDEKLAAGTITQERYDAMKSTLTERATAIANDDEHRGHRGMGGGMRGHKHGKGSGGAPDSSHPNNADGSSASPSVPSAETPSTNATTSLSI